MWAGIPESTEGPSRTRRQIKGEFALCLAGTCIVSCPGTSDIVLLVLWPVDSAGMHAANSPGPQALGFWLEPHPPAFLGLQLFWASSLQAAYCGTFQSLWSCESISYWKISFYIATSYLFHFSGELWQMQFIFDFFKVRNTQKDSRHTSFTLWVHETMSLLVGQSGKRCAFLLFLSAPGQELRLNFSSHTHGSSGQFSYFTTTVRERNKFLSGLNYCFFGCVHIQT